jgi:hypothetical protein
MGASRRVRQAFQRDMSRIADPGCQAERLKYERDRLPKSVGKEMKSQSS